MKKKVAYLIIIILILASQSFSSTGTLEKALEEYKNLLNDYNLEKSNTDLANKLKNELTNLAVYRLIRLETAGSVERKESASNIFDYLTFFYNNNKPSQVKERIALAGLLAYITSNLLGENLKTVTINNLPAFISAFNDYVSLLTKDFREISKYLLAYSIGLIDVVPEGFEDISTVGNVAIKTNLPEFSADKYGFYSDIIKIFQETNIKTILLQKAKEILKSNPKDSKELNRSINIASNSLARELRSVLSSYQLKMAEDIVKATPKRLNFWWLRFIAYAIFLAVFWIYFRKRLGLIIYLIISFESLYILAFSKGFFGKFDSVVYSLLVLVLLFSLYRFVSLLFAKKLSVIATIVGLLGIVVYVFSIFIPIYPDSEELKISNFKGFENSIYYELLKHDLYLDSTSDLNREIAEIYSLTSKEYSELKDQIKRFEKLVNALYDSKAISNFSTKGSVLKMDIPSFSEFYSISNWENYNSFLSELDKNIKDFNWRSKNRKNKIYRLVDDVMNRIKDYSTIFTQEMRDDLFDYLEKSLKRSNTTKFMLEYVEELKNDISLKSSEPIRVKIQKTPEGNVAIVLTTMVIILMFLSKRKYYKSVSLFLIANSVLWIFKASSTTIFVDKNVPNLVIKNISNPNLLVPVMFLIFSILSLVIKKTLKEG